MRYGGYENLGFPDKSGCLGVIIMDFECFEMTYPPIFKCFEASGGGIFA